MLIMFGYGNSFQEVPEERFPTGFGAVLLLPHVSVSALTHALFTVLHFQILGVREVPH